MATPKYNTYVGMRYVPIFDGEWNRNKTYEPLTIVSNQGNSYTSRTFVPTGVDINNTEYWALTGNYNAQVEYYRQETARVAEEIDRRIIKFNNVASMKTDENLENGFVCETVGYYSAGDGGSALYLITDTEPTGYHEELDGGLYAELINKYEVTPVMFGAVGDGFADDTVAIKSAISSGKVINLIGKEYKITGVLDFSGLENVELFGGTITRPARATFNTIDGGNCKNIYIHDVVFEGNGNTSDVTYTWRDNTQACCILAGNGCNIVFENNTVKDYNYGVFALGAKENSTVDESGINGKIAHNTFINCSSPVDTYGKDINVSFNAFLDITGNAIQIEPNETATDADNPQNGTYDYESGADCIIEGNYLKNISGIAINIHYNSYGNVIKDNLIIDFNEGISAGRSINVLITGNSIFAQKAQNVNADTRPWNVVGAIDCAEAIVSNNYIRNVYCGIKCLEESNIINNTLENIKMSGIIISNITGHDNDAYMIKGNVIKTTSDIDNYWYGCRAFVFNNGVIFIENNTCDSTRQPMYTNAAKLSINKLFSNVEFTGAYNKLDGYYDLTESNLLNTLAITSYLINASSGSGYLYKVGRICILSILNYNPSATSGDLFSSAIPAEWRPNEEIRGTLFSNASGDTLEIWARKSGIFGAATGNDKINKSYSGQLVYFTA